MKALTLWQPWASLMAAGVKTIETRHWPAPDWLIGRRVAIHAARRMVTGVGPELAAILSDGFGDRWPTDLPRGTVVATVRLIACRSTGIVGMPPKWVTDLSHAEYAAGNYAFGRYGWVTGALERLDPPVPARGRQGLWEWTP